MDRIRSVFPNNMNIKQQQQEQAFSLHPQQLVPLSTKPLPTHHPLQLMQWEQQDQRHNTWLLDKYNRLQDTRKQPLNVDRGPNDRLVVQFKDEMNKMVCVYHNYHELETFCIHPLLFTHDLVSRDNKLLFCIKDQIDGSIRYKFRVKFTTTDDVLGFCSAVAGYVTITSYEEWGRRNNRELNMSSTMSNSSFNNSYSDVPDENKQFADESTQTDQQMEIPQICLQNKTFVADKSGTEPTGVINVHFENLISEQAAKGVGRVFVNIVNKCIRANQQCIRCKKHKPKPRKTKAKPKPLQQRNVQTAENKRNEVCAPRIPKEEAIIAAAVKEVRAPPKPKEEAIIAAAVKEVRAPRKAKEKTIIAAAMRRWMQ